MGSPSPPHWTFAARAAYFGERMCSFCDHRNPAGAKFCNECASSLHLKPCNQCDAINDQAATNCHKCGAACQVSFSAPEAVAVLPSVESEPTWGTPREVNVSASVTQPRIAALASRAGWRVLTPGQFFLGAIATLLIAGAYPAYRTTGVTADATRVALLSIGAPESREPAATTPVPLVEESEPVEPERVTVLEAPAPETTSDAPTQASVVPVPSTKRASAHQRPALGRRALVPPVAHSVDIARVSARVAESRKALRPDPRKLQASLARCGGDLIARIVCAQRVRHNFCEGHWGDAPECPIRVAYEHRP